MSNMFLNCESLEELDISNFRTEQVKDMDCMFDSCTSLKKLYINNNIEDDILSILKMEDRLNVKEIADVEKGKRLIKF